MTHADPRSAIAALRCAIRFCAAVARATGFKFGPLNDHRRAASDSLRGGSCRARAGVRSMDVIGGTLNATGCTGRQSPAVSFACDLGRSPQDRERWTHVCCGNKGL
jgi:hypothetical protein